MNSSPVGYNDLFPTIFVIPDELTFIKDDIYTHNQRLTIYNPTQIVVKYEVTKVTPAKIDIKCLSGIVNPQCINNVFVKLIEFPNQESGCFNFEQRTSDKSNGNSLAILRFHDKKGQFLDQKKVRAIWLRYKPTFDTKFQNIQDLDHYRCQESSKKYIEEEKEKDEFCIVDCPIAILKSQQPSTRPRYDGPKNRSRYYPSLEGVPVQRPTVTLLNNRPLLTLSNDRRPDLSSPYGTYLDDDTSPPRRPTPKSILKPYNRSYYDGGTHECPFPREKCITFGGTDPYLGGGHRRTGSKDVNQMVRDATAPTHPPLNQSATASNNLTWFTVSLISGCLIVLALPNDIPNHGGTNTPYHTENGYGRGRKMDGLTRAGQPAHHPVAEMLWWSSLWPPRVSVQTKIIASYILGLITMAFLRR